MKKFILIASILITGGITNQIFAQTHIKALIEKCEKSTSIELVSLTKKDPKTQVLQERFIAVQIKNDPALVKEFIQAFRNDEADAYSARGTSKHGMTIPFFYQFYDGDKLYTTCRIAITDDKENAIVNANAAIIFSQGSYEGYFSWNSPEETNVTKLGINVDANGKVTFVKSITEHHSGTATKRSFGDTSATTPPH